MNSQQNDPKTTNSGNGYRRAPEQLISTQLLGTIIAIIVGVIGFQYQTGKIVAEVTREITTQNGKIEAIKEDVQEIKEALKESQR